VEPIEPATDLSLRQLGADATWKLMAQPGHLVVKPPTGGVITLEGEALRAGVSLTHALTGKPLLSLRLAGERIILIMEEADVRQLARGLGTQSAAATAVSVNASWNMIIGALIVASTIQTLVAPPDDMVVSVPLEGVRIGVGAVALIGGLLGRVRPRRGLLLLDAIWMAAIVADAIHNLLLGEGLAWLLTAIVVPVAWGRLRIYQLLAPPEPAPSSS